MLGPPLVRGLNAFCRGAARWCVVRKPLPADVRDMYLAPYDSWANRIAVDRFVRTIVAVGHPDMEVRRARPANPQPRKPMDQFAHWDKF